MEKRTNSFDWSKEVDLAGIKVSRRHLLRLLATGLGGAILARVGYERANNDKTSEVSNQTKVEVK